MYRRLGFLCAGLLLTTPAFAEEEGAEEEGADEGGESTEEESGDEAADEEPEPEPEPEPEAAAEPAAPATPATPPTPPTPAEVKAVLGSAPLTFSPVDKVELTIIGRVQARATLFDGDDPTNNDPVVYGDPGLREGVSIRRARIGVVGNVMDCFRLAVEGGWDNRYDAIHSVQAGFRLTEASVGFQPKQAVGVSVGFRKVAFGREATASSATLLMHERSMASEHMGKGREAGVFFGGSLGPDGHAVLPATAFHWDFGVSNGSANWFGDVDPQPRFAGRVRLDLGSDWDENESAWTLPEKAALSVGGSASYNRGLDANTLSLGADVGVRVWRVSLQGEILWASAQPAFDTEGIPTLQEARESLGWYGRVGVGILPEKLEVAFRVDGYNDNRTVEDAGDRMDLAVGLNSNLWSGRLRMQLFYVHRLELSDGHNTPNSSLVFQVQGRI